MRAAETAFSVGANATSTNRMSGQLNEWVRRRGLIILAAVCSAAGLNVTFMVNSQAVVSDQALSQANRFPNLSDDVIQRIALQRGGARLLLTFRNTTAGALTVNWFIDTPD